MYTYVYIIKICIKRKLFRLFSFISIFFFAGYCLSSMPDGKYHHNLELATFAHCTLICLALCYGLLLLLLKCAHTHTHTHTVTYSLYYDIYRYMKVHIDFFVATPLFVISLCAHVSYYPVYIHIHI